MVNLTDPDVLAGQVQKVSMTLIEILSRIDELTNRRQTLTDPSDYGAMTKMINAENDRLTRNQDLLSLLEKVKAQFKPAPADVSTSDHQASPTSGIQLQERQPVQTTMAQQRPAP